MSPSISPIYKFAFAVSAGIVLVGGESLGQEVKPEFLETVRSAVNVVGAKAFHQIHVEYNPNSHQVFTHEIWVSLDNGWSKRLYKKRNAEAANPLRTNIPEDTAPFTHGGWITDYGVLAPIGDSGDWKPISFPQPNIARELSRLNPKWVVVFESSLGKGGNCCGEEAGKALSFPAIDSSKELDKVVWEHPPHLREFHLSHGLVTQSTSTFDGIVTERYSNEFLESVDLTPPQEMQRLLATMPRITKASDVPVQPPLPPIPGQKSGFGFRAAAIPKHNGLMITEIWEGSPADRAGLKPYDWILSIDGTLIMDLKRNPSLELAEKKRVVLKVSHEGQLDRNVEIERAAAETTPILEK